MRCAQFAFVIMNDDDDVIASREYDDDGFNDKFDAKWVQYRENMLINLENNLSETHPDYEEIVNAIERERAFYRNAR